MGVFVRPSFPDSHDPFPAPSGARSRAADDALIAHRRGKGESGGEVAAETLGLCYGCQGARQSRSRPS
jgi:hypothetical protein